jgi:hypothetical protein
MLELVRLGKVSQADFDKMVIATRNIDQLPKHLPTPYQSVKKVF